jgi:hypothetical protein
VSEDETKDVDRVVSATILASEVDEHAVVVNCAHLKVQNSGYEKE